MPKITKELAVWFDYPDDPYEGRVHVRLLKQGEITTIMERAREIRTSFVKEFRQTEQVVKIAGAKIGIAIACIKDWENFIGLDDQPLECNPANIKMMCLEDGFLGFIDNCQNALEDMANKQKEAEAKN